MCWIAAFPFSLPDPEYKRGYTNGLLPYYLVGDEIFALKPWMMRPYPGKLAEEERVFNYRLSRSRRVIENVFGILRARWRIISRPIKASIENTERYIMAAVCLHNYLRQTENALYCPLEFVDSENSSGEIKRGEWRSIVGKADCFNPIARCKGGKHKEDANNMREALKAYVNSEEGSVSRFRKIIINIIFTYKIDTIDYIPRFYICFTIFPISRFQII